MNAFIGAYFSLKTNQEMNGLICAVNDCNGFTQYLWNSSLGQFIVVILTKNLAASSKVRFII